MSTLLNVFSAIGEGKTAEKISKIEAAQLEKQGVAAKAEAVQVAKNERKNADLLQSRAKAIAAKSGSSVSSLDVQNALSGIDQQGEYNALAALYQGYSSAASKNYAAKMAITEGKIKKRQSYIKAGSSILDAVQTSGGFG